MTSPKWLKTALGQTGGQVAIIVLAIPVIYLFGFREMRFFMVPSSSMSPTLLNGDYILTLNQKEYHRGDVVVLDDPEEAGSYIVKRIVAVGGDTVSVSGGALSVNGQYLSEPYVQDLPNYFLGHVSIPDGHIFVLGDNRNNSEDSHLWLEKHIEADPGVERIVGKVRCIYYPYTRAGEIQSYYFPVDTQSAEAR